MVRHVHNPWYVLSNSFKPSDAYMRHETNHHWSRYGLSPGRRQAIIWTNAGILLFQNLETSLSGILSEIHTYSFTKMHLKISSAKWRQFVSASIMSFLYKLWRLFAYYNLTEAENSKVLGVVFSGEVVQFHLLLPLCSKDLVSWQQSDNYNSNLM